MNAEERIQDLNRIPPLSPFERKRKMRTTIVLTISVVISMLFLIYAFMQKLEADMQYKIASEQRELAEQSQAEAERQRALAVEIERMAMVARAEAEKQRALAEKALADCMKGKK